MLAFALPGKAGTRSTEPGVPVVLVAGRVQQHVLLQIRQLLQGQRARQQLRRTHRCQLFIEQLEFLQTMIGGGAIHHRRIKHFATKIHPVLHRSGQLHWHIRAQRLPLHQPWQQPAHHAGGRLELQRGAARTDLLHTFLDQGEHLLHPWQPVLAFAGQAQTTGLAQEQGITEMILEAGNLPTDRTLGNVQQLRRAGEVAALGGDQKSMQGGQRRQAFHRASAMICGHG
ncbi:hypothetical protein D9M71_544850 [compost metagenome]